MDKIPFIHILYSGQLYGTERMTLNIAKGLSHEHLSTILTPDGLILAEAANRSIVTKSFEGNWDLVSRIKFYLVRHQKLVFATTSVSQSILIMLCNLFYRRQVVHLHMVHGGAEEYLSYGRKSLFNNLPVKLIAVSNYVRERLESHGVNPKKIQVIENFLLASEIEKIPKRQPFGKEGIHGVIVVSRLDPIKKVDLLFDTLDSFPELSDLRFHIFGFGKDMEKLKTKAAANYPQVILKGFSKDVFKAMANSDLLLHLCPVEPFGLAILEAIAIGLPVLIPNQGGTKTLVEDNISGFHFNANDAQDLGLSLLKLQQTSPAILNSVVKNAQVRLINRYLETQGINSYRRLIKFD
ncbi:glycosyltransferase family 4 protein [Waterburya agarophytonicola K14]|uniref:Glycosyltransferase family 4 protein n=1 Tax=Waterburya agarophytonicola KI4 TaxID=2874699 RepID=A0A964BRS1_9CYAN|nr:glycosyltransferase family 4 protein [Waterburya agarophytonicola]MCC0178503.1 glycosyltransferase family 4 protein [Waterburya agarophytonicola KI4]